MIVLPIFSVLVTSSITIKTAPPCSVNILHVQKRGKRICWRCLSVWTPVPFFCHCLTLSLKSLTLPSRILLQSGECMQPAFLASRLPSNLTTLPELSQQEALLGSCSRRTRRSAPGLGRRIFRRLFYRHPSFSVATRFCFCFFLSRVRAERLFRRSMGDGQEGFFCEHAEVQKGKPAPWRQQQQQQQQPPPWER